MGFFHLEPYCCCARQKSALPWCRLCWQSGVFPWSGGLSPAPQSPLWGNGHSTDQYPEICTHSQNKRAREYWAKWLMHMACSSLGARSETSFTAFSSGFSSSGGSWLRSIGFVHTTRHRDKSSSSTLKPPVILGYLCVHRLDSIYFHPKAVPRHERSISLYLESESGLFKQACLFI